MRPRSREWLIAGAAVLVLSGCQPPPAPVPRPGPPFDGSARWAWNIAAPTVSAFASDAQLYNILGSDLFPDGRLAANRGAWSFVTWSPSQQTKFQVTVNAAGTVSTSTTNNQTTPPGITGNPLPAGWANSTDVFQATVGHRAAGVSWTNLAVLNLADYGVAPGQPVWGINFDAPPNQLVRWDGVYLGAQ